MYKFNGVLYSMVTREHLCAEYLDWRNNYLSIAKFAEHRGLRVSEAEQYILLLKKIFEAPHPES